MSALQWAVPLAAFAGAIAGALLTMAFRRRAQPMAVAVPARMPPNGRAAATAPSSGWCARCRSASCSPTFNVASSSPTRPRVRSSDSMPNGRSGSHAIEAIPNVEIERRIDDALRGEASVAPLTLTGSGRATRLPRLGVSADRRRPRVARRRRASPTIKRPSCASIAPVKSFSPTFRTSCARRYRRSN